MASPPRTLLVAVDFSAPSKRALDHARMLAQLAGAKLVLVHVVHFPVASAAAGLGGYVPPPDPALLAADGREALARFARENDAGDATLLVRVGSVADEVLRAAEETKADVVVLGTHGRTGVAHAVLGSVAEGIARRAKVPILLVH